MNDILTAYTAISEQFKLPKLRPGALSLETKSLNQETLMTLCKNTNMQSGWFCFQSKLVAFMKPEESACLIGDYGYLLNAECVLDEKSSLHIHQQGDQWLVTTLEDSENDKGLIEEVSYLQMPDQSQAYNVDAGYLHYRVHWHHDAEHGYFRKAFRFTGFEN